MALATSFWMRVVLWVAAAARGFAQYPTPAGCAFFMAESIQSIVNAAYDIAQAATDCTLPGLSELACASDLTDMMGFWFQLSADLCAATLTCGSLDNECAFSINMIFQTMSDMSNNLVAASDDCIYDPFICTYDVVTAVDECNGMISSVISSVATCNRLDKNPDPAAFDFLVSMEVGPINDNRRRLTERQQSAKDKDPATAIAELRTRIAELEALGASLRSSASVAE